jgi:hypothetical protein
MRALLVLALAGVAVAAPKRPLKVTLDKTTLTAKRASLMHEKNFDRLIISFDGSVCNQGTTTTPKWKTFPAYLSIMFTLDKSSGDEVDLKTLPMPMAVNYMKTQLAHIGAPTGDVEGTLVWIREDRVRVHGKAAAHEMAANDGSVVLTAPQVTFDGEIDVVACPVK